jgi:hypothetical protein
MNKNLYTNGMILIFKIYFHNIRGTQFENHCSTSSRLAPGFTQPPIQREQGALSTRLKRPGREADY